MNTYHKIQTVFKRDKSKPNNPIIIGDWTLPEFEYLKNNEWVWTEKVDGTNIRVMFNGKEMSYNGKTDNAQTPRDLLSTLINRFNPQLEKFKEMFGVEEDTAVCLYGEGYGAGIQKGGCYRPDKNFVLFDVKIGDMWLERKNVEDIATKLGVDIVPIVGVGTIQEAIDLVKKGFNSTWGDFIAEGLVLRTATELRTRRGDRMIAKIKYKDFS